MFQQQWKTSYAQSYFFGVQHQPSDSWYFEANGTGALGRRLITTDLVNRPFSLRPEEAGPGNSGRYYNPALPVLAYRATQGSSNYHAFAALARYRSRRVHFQGSYTWSH